jgi:SHS family lactate transporter-like MFS transporter
MTCAPRGNLVSSASSTIEATIGERFPLPAKGSVGRFKYGLVICIFMGCVYAYVMVIAFIGPEYLGRRLDASGDKDFADSTGAYHDGDAAPLGQGRVKGHDDDDYDGAKA